MVDTNSGLGFTFPSRHKEARAMVQSSSYYFVFISNFYMHRNWIKNISLTAMLIQNRQGYAKLMEILLCYNTMAMRNLEDLMPSEKVN